MPGATVTAAGIERETSSKYVWEGMKRADRNRLAFQYTIGGEGRLTFEGTEHRVRPGQAMLLYFPHDHSYWLREGTWEFFWVCFAGEELLRIWQDLVGVVGPLVELGSSSPVLRAAVNLCARAREGSIGSPYEASELAFAFAIKLLEELVPTHGELPARLGRRAHFVVRVEAYCQKNLARPIGVRDMARVAGMSHYHFSRKFREAVGISPGKYLTSLRLEQARKLLQVGRMAVNKVAVHCGFSDTQYFSRVFRDRYHVLPHELRER
jgi:AraC-like DNA-binding protein